VAPAGPALLATCPAWEGCFAHRHYPALARLQALPEVHPAPILVTTGGSSLSQPLPRCKPPAVLRSLPPRGGYVVPQTPWVTPYSLQFCRPARGAPPTPCRRSVPLVPPPVEAFVLHLQHKHRLCPCSSTYSSTPALFCPSLCPVSYIHTARAASAPYPHPRRVRPARGEPRARPARGMLHGTRARTRPATYVCGTALRRRNPARRCHEACEVRGALCSFFVDTHGSMDGLRGRFTALGPRLRINRCLAISIYHSH
jgi:hypothetical protein